MRVPSRLRPIAGALLGLPLAASASWVGYSALFVPHRLGLPAAVSGERREFASNAGRLSYYLCGPAKPMDPLLLVHSVNAAASAYEVRPLYEHYCKTRTVYALELPGFGFSERPDRAYTPRLMTDAILAMASQIAATHGGAAIDALALSLSSEFLVRAAAERPAVFRSIALVSPTGFSRNMPTISAPNGSYGMPTLRRVISFPLWSRALYDLLTSKPSIRFFLQKAWGSKDIDEGLLEYDYLTTHQPGAPYAPYFFVSGFLFSLDIQEIYRSLPHPVWMAHGIRGDFTDFARANEFERLPNWKIEIFATGALPHFETPGAFIRTYDAFMATTR